jgi:hypothetical protein
MRTWVIVRWAIIVASAVGALFTPLRPQALPPIDWGSLSAIFLFCIVGMVFVLGLQVFNPHSAKEWLRPSWQLNPFNFHQPLQFFHLGAYVCLASGLVVLARLAILQVPFYVEALVPVAMAVGVLLGIQLVTLVFRAKIEHRA